MQGKIFSHDKSNIDVDAHMFRYESLGLHLLLHKYCCQSKHMQKNSCFLTFFIIFGTIALKQLSNGRCRHG